MESNEPTAQPATAQPETAQPAAAQPPAPPPVDRAALLMGLDELEGVAKGRLLSLNSHLAKAVTADETAKKAVRDAQAALQEAIGADQRARQSVATSSTEQEFATRAQVAKEALEKVVVSRTALQDAMVVQFRTGWQLAWLRQRLNTATSDAAGATAMMTAAATAVQARKTLVDAIDDLGTWRQNLLDKLAGNLPPAGNRHPTLAEALDARSASLLTAPDGITDSPSEALYHWADERFEQLPPRAVVPAGPLASPDDLTAALAAVDSAAAALAQVQPAIRIRLERAAVAAARPGPVGFGLSFVDFNAMATALGRDPARRILHASPPAPPATLAVAAGLLIDVPPAVWSLLLDQVEAEHGLAAAMAADGAAERQGLVDALSGARTVATDRADAIRAAEAADDPPASPPTPDLVEAFRAAMPFPYGLS